MKYYFKVKYGYSMSDQVSVEINEVEKAIYAQITGKPVQLADRYIKGSNIISIEPHYHRHTGWNDWYEPKDSEDWKQIKRDCPDYAGLIEQAKQHVAHLIQVGTPHLIGQDMTYMKLPEVN